MSLRYNIIVLIFISSSISFAQVDLSAGMGIDFSANSSLYDFLNSNHKRGPGNQLFVFDSNIEFYFEGTYPVSPDYEAGAEYDYAIYSYNTSYGTQYELSYYMHSITLSGYYVIRGKGYKLKFGGGAGYRYMSLNEKYYNVLDYDYSLNGAGIQFKADGNTALGSSLYANIALILKFDYLGKPKNVELNPNISSAPISKVNFFIISPGIRLGVSYFL